MFAKKRLFRLACHLGLCADSPMSTGIEASILSEFSQLTEEKIVPASRPSGKSVKIALGDADGVKPTKVLIWNPDKEKFHEVIKRATPDGVVGFEVYYKDGDGDKIQLDDIEAFLADHGQLENLKLQVEWRFPTSWEVLKSKVRSAKDWLIGNGGATDQAVKEAKEKVEGNGGKMVVSSGSGRSCLEHRGYDKEEWPAVVQALKAELQLEEADERGLLNAARCKERKGQHFRQKASGNKITTVFIAYHTICQDDKIDLIYGKHEECMEVSGAAMALPSENCIQYNGTIFAVWPPASPQSNVAGTDMRGLVAEIPSGWQLVDSTQKDFDNIRKRVIAPYGWHAVILVTSGPNGQIQGWKTAHNGSSAGDPWGISSDCVEKKDTSGFHFKDGSRRLLIQAKPSATPELINNWEQFVKLSAQREWSQQLGLPQGGSVQV